MTEILATNRLFERMPMPTPEEFMRDYLREHIEAEKRELASRAPFREKFFTGECYFDSRKGTLEAWESEKIASVSSSDTGAIAITELIRKLHSRVLHQKHRYHLQLEGNRWRIQCVDSNCIICKGEAVKITCRFCHGTGWRSGNPGTTDADARDE